MKENKDDVAKVISNLDINDTGSGLLVKRVYTTEGVHPYDDVKWERREVVQTNWKTNETVFEQRDVEFPDFWSQNASTIVTTKYFRGALNTPSREWSLRQVIDRVVKTYVKAALENNYMDADNALIFEHELTWMLLHQVFSFNSPVWFNVGTSSPQYVSACFILAVDDTMDSILNWYREEGLIFKGGSGAGTNLSKLRSSKELLRQSGGRASGPVSFMRGADSSAGAIKSGGATRRAAKMVVLDVDHPDIEEFIETKSREEKKIRALRDAGFDMDLDGKDIASVQFQNANNSVRLSDKFMTAVEKDENFDLIARIDKRVVDTVNAKNLWRKIATAAWECADPGVQYDDTINEWHTNPVSGRINASNPCFPADQRVVTNKGLVRIEDLFNRGSEDEDFKVYTNDVTNEDSPSDSILATSPTRYMQNGVKEVLELKFSDGSRIRCTPNHRLWTTNGWVRAEDLTEEDKVVKSINLANRDSAINDLSYAVDFAESVAKSSEEDIDLPKKWNSELAHYLGWLVGDGCITSGSVITVYGNDEDKNTLVERHANVLNSITGKEYSLVKQSNGTGQLKAGQVALRNYLKALGFSDKKAPEKVVPEAIYQAPQDALVHFIQGLFDADGCVVNQVEKGTRYVGLGSRSEELLLGVQELLASLGIHGRIYTGKTKTDFFSYTRKDGTEVSYSSDGPSYDLRLSGKNIESFAKLVGFSLPSKAEKLATILSDHEFYEVEKNITLRSRVSIGQEMTYNLTEPRNHSYIVSGIVVANCSEYVHLDNSSCNLASLNLMKFRKNDGSFDHEGFARAVELIITAMEISISFADFPTKAIGDNTRNHRQLGIGYANLGALLMSNGVAYDSPEGRALAGSITSLMTAVSYRRSAEIAKAVGAYKGYVKNAEAHKNVMNMHKVATEEFLKATTTEENAPTFISEGIISYNDTASKIARVALKEWKLGIKIGEEYGWRNAQASVLAPTGCLVGNSLVTTDRGLTRLVGLGNPDGKKWQNLKTKVSTDEGAQLANKFYINGLADTRLITTKNGYKIQGTPEHRIKVISKNKWVWKRFGEITPEDVVPMQSSTFIGEPNQVVLPLPDEGYWMNDGELKVPNHVTKELATLVGYFMGDGSLHAKGLRFAIDGQDEDVAEKLSNLIQEVFGLKTELVVDGNCFSLTTNSVRLVRWWQASGFAKFSPYQGFSGKGWTPHIPDAILETNDPVVYGAFLSGLFEADGSASLGMPNVDSVNESFIDDIRSMMLMLGFPTKTKKMKGKYANRFGQKDMFRLRIRGAAYNANFSEKIGFLSERKINRLESQKVLDIVRGDYIYLRDGKTWVEIVDMLEDKVLKDNLRQAIDEGKIGRSLAEKIHNATKLPEITKALEYQFETIISNEDGGEQLTYDISVPSNVTYVANGFISHNTISFMMDCDTTGVEPDFSLVKFKKLVGGSSMKIVNNQVDPALRSLGYQNETIEAIEAFIAENGHVVNAPGLKPEHYSVFDCAIGERAISPNGHIRMMAAVQPFISGAISKTVNLPESATIEDIESVYFDGWKLGLKAIAVYRDNCKVGQPLSDGKNKKSTVSAEPTVIERVVERIIEKPARRRLPSKRHAEITSFSVSGAKGILTVGLYEDGKVGEVFIKMSKQGSTLAGIMDALSIAISMGLQYGVPLEAYVAKFTNMQFEPRGMTEDKDVRMAQSLIDYIFRRLALDYLNLETREGYGILTTGERTANLNDANNTAIPLKNMSAQQELEREVLLETEEILNIAARKDEHRLDGVRVRLNDAPLCVTCGVQMVNTGACNACPICGSTTGCS